ncbi:ACT domain-containing protein [Candidatus Micrarchaeota archaeon]|nr:ACT domain-containing protein [Candidatus Micrarchaeota archaeon]
MKENISQLVWLYVKQRPFLQEVLREGVVNHSALARKISIEAFGSTKKQNAVKMALIRLGTRMEQLDSDLEARILRILKKSSMALKTKVAVIIAKRELEGIRPLSRVKSGQHVTYIVEQRDLEKLPPKALWKREENLNLITIESPEELEEVPGVISYILGALSSEGVNVVEFISCYTDTLLVVRGADSAKAYGLLSSILR